MHKKVSIVEVEGQRMLVFDNEVFDWGLSEEDFDAAKIISNNDPEVRVNFIAEIQKHLLTCLREMLGRPVTLAQLNKAITDGEIILTKETEH